MADKQAKYEEGKQLLKKGKSKCSASILSLRFKPDWEVAGPLFEKAALCFKVTAPDKHVHVRYQSSLRLRQAAVAIRERSIAV